MLDKFFALIADMAGERQETFEAGDYRVAAAALLVHVMTVDGDVAPVELAKLKIILSRGFTLGAHDTELLIEAATNAENEAVDLTTFTAVLVRKLDETERRRIVEMMWSLVLADGEAHEFEEAVVARAADLLGVPQAGAQRPEGV
ncbi:TerB family tellurite resistance protein [Phreatobacter stygius]|uniref:TerB family tellurite resistance protein n=1 Tax=Phreatobacter stygius TaxID=1940610 RepID=A0A4D7AWU3_9HYPH|nr:TerB family tellurite resistance protein [Phreatobacter stygius]QCI64501.1 TerB family tellurite resistance protein [Phreatobacter stygius]